MTILDEIAQFTKSRVEREKEEISLEKMKELAFQKLEAEIETANRTPSSAMHFSFEEKLSREGIHFICEVKKASPSKGIIAKEFPYLQIAREYEEAGADCISVLTEPKYFLGDNRYLSEIKKEVKIPVLRKDFIIDEYQIYQAKSIGADCVLLICSLFDFPLLQKYRERCDELGMSALVEAHDEEEVRCAAEAGARIIGVNNRNLKTFEIDFENSIRLRTLVPSTCLFVAESGIKTSEDMKRLKEADVNAVLIGETLMRSRDKKKALLDLKGEDGKAG